MNRVPGRIITPILAVGVAATLAGCAGSPAVTPTTAPTATLPDAGTVAAPTGTATPLIPDQPTLDATEEPLSSIWPECSSGLNAVPVTFVGANGEDVEGALMGDGETGVVLSNQSDNKPCDWAAFTQALLDAKYQVLSYKYGNGSGAGEASAGAAFLLKNGAKRVILVGASRGGAFTATAASRSAPGVSAAVTLSAATLLPGDDPLAVVSIIAVPILVVSADVDPSGSYPMAQAIDKLLTITDKQLLIVPGGPHGIALMDDPDTRGKVLAFMEAHR